MNERSLVGQDVILRAGCQPAPTASTCERLGQVANRAACLLIIFAAASLAAAQDTKPPAAPPAKPFPPALVSAGEARFIQQCAFCHGRDAAGGEDGPDLTRSKLVTDDRDGDQIGSVVRNGRAEKGMPRFTVSDQELSELVAYIKTQKTIAESQVGGRRGVDVADLQTGNAMAGKKYFDGEGKCASCHSPTGDLSGLANRLQGLKLEQRFLYPKDVKSKIVVTLASGEKIAGTLAYQDEFNVALTDASGRYRAWAVDRIQFAIDAPVEAHADLLMKYTDTDIHNLMAYLQTLK
jgi:cytochrome c oxidase cbb3-type subunit III